MEELLKQAPKVIREAAKSPLGIAALFILVIGAVGVAFFQDTVDWIKLAAYLMLIGGCLAFGLLAFRRTSTKPIPVPPASKEVPARPSSDPLAEQARTRFAEAERLHFEDRNDQARTAYEEARTLYKQVGDRLGEANALQRLGDLESQLGRNDQARAAYDEARTLSKQVGNRRSEANVLRGLGDLESTLGRNNQARAAYDEARTLYKQEQNRLGEANVLRGLGHLESKLGRNDQARAAYDEARTLYKQDGDRLGEANVLLGLGQLERMLGRNDQARAAYQEARTLYKHEQNRLGEANVLFGLGQLEAAEHPKVAVRDYYDSALLYMQMGMTDWHDRALAEAERLSH